MIRILLFSFLLLPSLSLAHWDYVKVAEKAEIFQSHVLVREVKIGKSLAMAAILQNSKVSSKLYGDFAKVQPDDVAKYLLKSFSPKFEKEMIENVSLYRTQTDVDHIRLMVKKRKNDFLISFAFVKKAFLYRSYNETDFFQRLFIATENKKSADSKTSKLFHLPTLLMSETAHAAGFSFDGTSLLNSINSVSNRVSFNSSNNFAFAAQNLEPGLNKIADSFASGASSLQRGVTAIEAVPSAADRLSAGFNNGARTIETGLNRVSNTFEDPKTWLKGGVALGVGVQIGTMFSNLVALGINTAYTAMRDVMLDFLSIYKPGEKEAILQQADRAWREYEALSEQMVQNEKELQSLEIALQLASGKSVEEIYNLDPKSMAGATSSLSVTDTGKSCVPGSIPSLEEIEKLRRLADAIKNNPEVKAKLCERVNRSMNMIEGLSEELTLVRTRLSSSMLVTYNTIYKEKLSSLKAPKVTSKATKECVNNAKDEIEEDEDRFKKWECSKTPNEPRCASLTKLMAETKGDIPGCDDKSEVILARDDDQYIRTRAALRKSRKRMDDAMYGFLSADCEETSKEAYCKKQNGSVAQVKAAYNSSLKTINENQCNDSKVQAPRFVMEKDVYHGNLPTTQDGLTPQPVVAGSNLVTANGDPVNTDGEARLPASETTTGTSEPNIFMRGWNAFMNSMKSLFSWFGK